MSVLRYLLARSVRVRVTAAAVLAVGAALAGSAALVDANLQHDRQRVLMTTAEYEARTVSLYNPQLVGPLDLPKATIQTGLIQVIRDGKVLGASPLLRRLPPLWLPGDPDVESVDLLSGVAKDVHQVRVPIDDNGVKADIVVVTSLDQYDHSVAFVRQSLEVGIPVLLAVVGLICWMMVGRALRPIEMMRREVDDVVTIRGAERLAEPATDDEVGRLARTLNSMLDRIESSSQREHRFVSDASHELRSPIANIRTELEVALHRPDRADWPSVANQVLGQNERMANLVDGLLLLARSDEGSLMAVATASDLAAVAQGVVAGVGPAGPIVVLDARPALVDVPAIYLERMISNLIDNARRFASTRVEVAVRAGSDMGRITVTDDGPGIPASQRSRIFERFVRLDEARDRVEGGFGLGLAIVADLCRFYGGRIEVSDAAPGARFVLVFPLSGIGSNPVASEATDAPGGADGTLRPADVISLSPIGQA